MFIAMLSDPYPYSTATNNIGQKYNGSEYQYQ